MKNTLLILSSVMTYLVSSVGYANNNANLLLNLTHCSTISNDDVRLVCFDKLVSHNAKQSVVAVAPVVPSAVENKSVETTVVESKPVKQAQLAEGFAKEHLKKTSTEQGPTSINATVSKVKQLLRGQWVIYFENGQKWQQTDKTKIKLKVSDKVRLKKGAMGAVYLFKEGSHRSIKVKRLK